MTTELRRFRVRVEDAPDAPEEARCFSDSLSDGRSLSSYTSGSFDDNASIVTVIRLVNDAVDSIESDAYHWKSSSQSSMWLSPSRLRPPELASHWDLSEAQQAIRRGGSMRSLQLDDRLGSPGRDGDGPGAWAAAAAAGTSFQWERNHSGGWERRPGRLSDGRAKDPEEPRGDRRRSRDSGGEDGSSPVYEEYRGPQREPEETESLYDTLPPTRRAYEGYPAAPPPGLHLHPAQLQPPLRAWDGGPAGGCRGPEAGPGEPGGLGGTGDELERLLNLVSLRARRATRTHRSSTGSEPTKGWEGF
ncbi:Protocadherin Fat 3 [Merluccius polli]|uniref:Protocadherin Fat 3 n=1 Tax=Merluccius polli TaxID=89951 RepID=A0AA47P1H8_MERPO|nr:Protocadherin Fat 3 [Merluccius polli]